MRTLLSRRTALATIVTSAFAARRCQSADPDPRELRFDVKDEFGGASTSNIEALLASVAKELWQHGGNVTFTTNRFSIYRNEKYPITHFKHDDQDRIVIGLNTEGLYWAQYSYQFAHEFCHALIDHTNAKQKQWHGLSHANHWLDECLCETASLFALRAMSRTWRKSPPFPNWKSFAPKLAKYVDERLMQPAHRLPDGTVFTEWFAQELPSLRKQPTQREKNTIIASQLLPVFEAQPSGWEAVTMLKLGLRDEQRSLEDHLKEWRSNTRDELKSFVDEVKKVFLG